MPSHHDRQLLDNRLMRQVLGDATARLVDIIAGQAQKKELSLFLVGGVVRDLLLNLPNQDLDFVLESDAIRFTDELAGRFGGAVQTHRPFGTAKWMLDCSRNGGSWAASACTSAAGRFRPRSHGNLQPPGRPADCPTG